MGRLVWKEFREKRIWALALAGSTAGVVIAGQGYTFAGQFEAFSTWVWPSVILSLLFGAGAFASELAARADFLYSRPAPWKKVLLAKVAVGLAIVLASVALAAVLYRLLRPEQYAFSVTGGRIVLGMGYAALILGGGYFAGLVCSVVLPGVFGGLLTFLGLLLALGIRQSVIQLATRRQGPPDWFDLAWPVGAALAAVLTVRFGLTLPTGRRLARYGATVLVVVLVATVAGFAVPARRTLGSLAAIRWSSISPDGRYAVTWSWDYLTPAEYGPRRGYMIRLRDGRRARIGLPAWVLPKVYWTDSGTAFFYQDGALGTVRMDVVGRAVQRTVDGIGTGRFAVIHPSQGRRLAAVRSVTNERKVEFADIEGARKLETVLRGIKVFWWQSDSQVGYIDSRGKRHVVKVLE